MKIVKLQASNFKRLVAVEISPDGNVVRITGKNGAGKSSVLDAIITTLGGAKMLPDKPIRDGETYSQVVAETEAYIITQKIRGSKRTVEMTTKEGAKISSPQALLKSIVGPISFDPLAFSEMNDKEQRELLLSVLGLNLEEHDKKINQLRTDRSELLAQKKRADQDLSELKQTPGLPEQEISVAELSKKLTEAHAVNNQAADLDDEFQGKQQSIQAWREEIKATEQKIATASARCEEISQLCGEIELVDTDSIQEQIDSAEETNKKIRANIAYREAANKTNALAEQIKEKYDAILEAENAKARAIGEADMPVTGLSVDENGVLLDGIPLRQVNHARRLELSLAMAEKMSGELRVALINGNGLDDETWKTIIAWAEKCDFQVWAEVATNGEKGVGIVIEDGSVVE